MFKKIADVFGENREDIFLWLPNGMDDRYGVLCKIITFGERNAPRVVEGGGNDGFGDFVTFNNIKRKNSKTNFKQDQLQRQVSPIFVFPNTS